MVGFPFAVHASPVQRIKVCSTQSQESQHRAIGFAICPCQQGELKAFLLLGHGVQVLGISHQSLKAHHAFSLGCVDHQVFGFLIPLIASVVAYVLIRLHDGLQSTGCFQHLFILEKVHIAFQDEVLVQRSHVALLVRLFSEAHSHRDHELFQQFRLFLGVNGDGPRGLFEHGPVYLAGLQVHG